MNKTVGISIFTLGLTIGAVAQGLYREHEREQWLNSQWGKYFKLRGAQWDKEQETCNQTNKPNTTNHAICLSHAMLSWGQDIKEHGRNLELVSHKIK